MDDGSFWDEDVIVAAVALVLAIAVAQLVDRGLSRRGTRVAEAMTRGELSREMETRLRFVRRAVYAVIVGIGVVVALNQFEGINRFAASLAASGVVVAAIVGFAARQTLANVVAGLMLTITQPIRVGDWVTVEGNYGVVEDLRLNYTVLRAPGEQRVLIPNEKIAASVIKNDTLQVEAVVVEVDLWIPAGADAARAVEVLGEVGEAAVAETVPWGTRLSVGGPTVTPPERGPAEGALRARCHAQLREAGLLEGFGAPERS